MSFYPREHVGSQACCPLEGFASCVCSQETGQGLGSTAGNGQGVYLWPLELTHQLFLSFPLTQGKLASFFLSRVDALSPQLQQVKEKEGDGEPGGLSWSFTYVSFLAFLLLMLLDHVLTSFPVNTHKVHKA